MGFESLSNWPPSTPTLSPATGAAQQRDSLEDLTSRSSGACSDGGPIIGAMGPELQQRTRAPQADPPQPAAEGRDFRQRLAVLTLPAMAASSEGTIEVEDGYRVWYRRVGSGERTPLLVLHGGPGAGHDYLETLEALADERPVIFYDQLGCGRSDKPDDPSRWHIGRFVREVDLVRQALGLSRIHLLGQSWGGWLAIEYMLGQPAGIDSLILASTSASIPQFVAECERLKSELPPDVYATLQKYEAAHDYRHPAYEKAAEEFYKRHLCRLWPWPDSYLRTVRNLDE